MPFLSLAMTPLHLISKPLIDANIVVSELRVHMTVAQGVSFWAPFFLFLGKCMSSYQLWLSLTWWTKDLSRTQMQWCCICSGNDTGTSTSTSISHVVSQVFILKTGLHVFSPLQGHERVYIMKALRCQLFASFFMAEMSCSQITKVSPWCFLFFL